MNIDPQTLQYLIYAAFAVAGVVLRHFHLIPGLTPAPTNPALPAVPASNPLLADLAALLKLLDTLKNGPAPLVASPSVAIETGGHSLKVDGSGVSVTAK